MSKPDFKILADAHGLTGFLKGLSEGVEHWRPDDISQGMLDGLQFALARAHAKSERVANFISELAEGEGK